MAARAGSEHVHGMGPAALGWGRVDDPLRGGGRGDGASSAAAPAADRSAKLILSGSSISFTPSLLLKAATAASA